MFSAVPKFVPKASKNKPNYLFWMEGVTLTKNSYH